VGQLPDPEGLARDCLAKADPEEVKVGLRFIALHQLEPLVPDLLQLVASEPQEGVLVAVLETLGALGSPQAVEPVLALLHSGQNARLQLALASALRDLGDPAGALALCAKVAALSSPELHTVAVEALARAHATAGQPLPPLRSAVLVTAVRGAWTGRIPSWTLRRRIGDALVSLHLEHPPAWNELTSLIQETLHEKRPSGAVPTEDIAQLQASARILAQRAHG